MELVIDFDNIKEPGKKEWLLSTLKLMGIGFHATEPRQTIAEYNDELESANSRIEAGNFITAEDLKIESRKW